MTNNLKKPAFAKSFGEAREVLMGNEAIVQGALEAGVDFVTMYPGCPSAEIGDEFGKIASESIKKNGSSPFHYEISTNEKVALEAAVGASFSGLKSLVAMKNFGVNVCSEVLLPLLYTGTKAPMVIVVGDDPGCWSSAQTEENSRAFSLMAHLPTLEPADSQECRDFVKLGFEISEKFNLPVMVRTTIRVAHERSPVSFVKIDLSQTPHNDGPNGHFVKNFHQYVTLPPRVLEMKKELLEKIEKIRAYLETSKVNFTTEKTKNNKLGIVTSGVAYSHTMQALSSLELKIPVLKLGSFYPLPKKKITKFISQFKQVLVVEELDPYLERELKIIANDAQIKIKIIGKEILPQIGELNVELIENTIAKILKLKIKKSQQFQISNFKFQIPRRTSRLCEGCPYWFALPVIKKLAPENVVWGGDIGCNMMTGLAPHNMQDYLFCMGSSIGIGHGIAKSVRHRESHDSQKVITIMGDGTFFHSGMAGLINAVYNKSNPLMIILDNRITAMTGHQQNPGMGLNGMWQQAPEMNIEEIVKAFGVRNVKTLDQENPGELEAVMKDFLIKDDVSVIICKRICAILDRRQKKQ